MTERGTDRAWAGLGLLLSACGQPGVLVGLGDTGGGAGVGGGEVGGGVGGDDGDPEPVDGLCEPAVDATPGEDGWVDVDEGDRVVLELACTGELALSQVDVSLEGAPRASTLEEGVFEWATDGADAGGYELLFTVQQPGAQGLPETLRVSLWVNDVPGADGAELVDPATYTREHGLPVIHVDGTGSWSEYYQAATVWWQGKEYPANAKYRGASSVSYPKPGYLLEFEEDELDLDGHLEGWGPDDRDHLALLTPFDDNSYVRQKLVYDQWMAMAEYWGEARLTPRTFFVVVYVDGRYRGLFMGLDRPDNEFIRHMGLDDTGNLYKAVNHNANFYLTDYYGTAKSSLASGYEKKEGSPESDYSDLEQLVSFTGSASDAQLVSQAEDWFPLDEFMDWFLLVTYSLSEDSAGKNSYLYHDPSTDRWRYIPWDFNHSWGQNWYTLRLSSSSINEFEYANRIFKAVLNTPSAEEALWDRFKAMRADGPFHPDWIEGQLDAYFSQIDRAAAKDWDTWAHDYQTYSRWASYRNSYGDWTDYEGEKAYLYEWTAERAELYAEYIPD